jgi:hypothetical protein
VTEQKFNEERLPVADLTVDREIQRSFLDLRKVERIVGKFNPAALGIITVSKRNAVTMVVLDGMHRVEAVRRITSNMGDVLTHTFEGLTREEEAQLFLDLNAGNQPNLLDRFKARIIAGDQDAKAIDEIIHSYGWKFGNNANDGLVACVGAVEKIYNTGKAKEFEPELLGATFMVVTHAWGMQSASTVASILEAVAAVVLEYGNSLDLDRLVQRLKNYGGGPYALTEDGKSLAKSLRARPSMGIATRIVDHYNVGMKTRKVYPWRHTR